MRSSYSLLDINTFEWDVTSYVLMIVFCRILFWSFTFLFTFSVRQRFRLYICKRRKRISIGLLLKQVIFWRMLRQYKPIIKLSSNLSLSDYMIVIVSCYLYISTSTDLSYCLDQHTSDNNHQMNTLIDVICVLLRYKRSSNFRLQ